MAQVSYKINLPAADQAVIAKAINDATLPFMTEAVAAIAQVTSEEWQEAVLKARGIWQGEKDAYVQTIKWKMDGPWAAKIYSDYKYAYEIETGRPARDLKTMLNTSEKVRRTTKGHRFLVIPFRHNTPGNDAIAPSMPPVVHDLAKILEPSRIVGQGTRPSGEVTYLSPKTGMSPDPKQTPYLTNMATKKAAMVVKNNYSWGGRLTAAALTAAGADAATMARYQGMVKMGTSSNKQNSSQYLTFRIMMDTQVGKWIVPAKPGLYIAKKVAEDMQPRAEAALQAAAQKSI